MNRKLIGIPAIALAAGISLAACSSQSPPKAAPAPTVTVTAPTPKPSATAPKPAATGADAQWVACRDWERASNGGISSPMGLSVQGLDAAISASTDPVLTGYLKSELSDQNAGRANAVTADVNNVYNYCDPATPTPSSSPTTAAPAAAWSTNCVVLGDNQFRLYATNNSGQGQTTPGWTVQLYQDGAQVGSVDNSGAGVLPDNYASPGQTVSSHLWTLNSQTITSCAAAS